MTTLATFAVSVAGALVACGGDDNSSAPAADAGLDGTTSQTDSGGGMTVTPPSDAGGSGNDSGSTGDDDASATDGGQTADGSASDAGDGGDLGACSAGAACSANGQTGGLCNAGTCTACTQGTDDSTCNTVYGSTGNPYICQAGQCLPGNCHVDSDCGAGQICGLTTPNTCGGCTADAQCQSDATYGASYVCNTTTNECVTAACTSSASATAATETKTTCTQNASDVCCSTATPPTTTGACVAGNCCSASDCTTGQTCTNHTCTSCLAGPVLVTNGLTSTPTYYVDPNNGSDVGATGSAKLANGTAASSCAFQTITRALEAIGTATSATNIVINSTTTPNSGTTLAAGEKYPIQVPANITIVGPTTTTAPSTIPVPTFSTTLTAAKAVGFNFTAAGSGLSGLIIHGGGVATSGIDVGSGGNATLSNVTIDGMLSGGIRVGNTGSSTTGGILAINQGVVVTGTGTASARASGLIVNDNGAVTITGTSGNPIQFNGNTEHGIDVLGSGTIKINAATTPTAAPTSSSLSVQALGNYAAGLVVSQSASVATQSLVYGLASGNSTNGNGIRIGAGSNVKVRGSWALGNSGSGIAIVTYEGSGGTTNNTITNIDLGTGTNYGFNTLQATTSPNAGTGLCLNLGGNAVQTLNANGNTFVSNATPATSLDCSLTAGGTLTSATSCTGGTDIGFAGKGTNDVISVTNCTP